MKKLLILAVLLAGCENKPELPAGNLAVPSYFCTQTPNGESRTNTRMAYCGKGCSRPEEYKQFAVDVSCKYTEWRNE